MRKSFIEWLPYIGIAILPGIVNIIAAWQELNKQCRFLPFFKPHRSLGFWIWLLLQFTAPILLFLGVNPLNSKPTIDLKLVFEALGLGVGFVVVLNATTEVGSLSFGLKPVYNFFVDIAYNLIANKQTGRTAAFWHDLEKQLNQPNTNLIAGLNYLENYFNSDPALRRKQQELQEKLNKLDQARRKTPEQEQVKEIKSLIMMNVRRNDLTEVLNNFNCSQELLNRYFP